MGTDINVILASFSEAKPRKTVFGNYRIEGDVLKFIANSSDDKYVSTEADFKALIKKVKELDGVFTDQDRKNAIAPDAVKFNSGGMRLYFKFKEENIVARKLNGSIVGNSSVLPLIGRKIAYGHVNHNRSVTPIQTALSRKHLMIPFTVFEQADLDITKFEVIERGSEETVEVEIEEWNHYRGEKTKRIEKRHFTGATLFKVDGKTYLFDIDRREIKHKIFNPFLVQLTKSAKTIAEAYEILKPEDVKRAEKAGLKVLRQGEWFFIPAPKFSPPKLNETEKLLAVIGGSRWGTEQSIKRVFQKDAKNLEKKAQAAFEKSVKPIQLRAGQNRPNSVETGIVLNGETFVTGTIEHDGREHAPLKLTGWYQAVPNTSTRSFTITGDVD